MVSAGEAAAGCDAARLFRQATGIEIIDGIGSTEMIHIFISHTPQRAAPRRNRLCAARVPGRRAR